MGGIVSPVRRFLEKISYGVSKLYRINNDPFDVRVKKSLILIFVHLCIVAVVGFGALRLYEYLTEEDSLNNLISAIIEFCIAVIFLVDIFLFIFHQNFEVFFNLFVYAAMAFLATVQVASGRGINSPASIFMFCGIFLAILTESKMRYIIIGVIGSIIVTLYVFDVVNPPMIANNDYQYAYMMMWAGVCIVWLFLGIVMEIKQRNYSKQNKLLARVTEAVSTLQLDCPAVEKLMKMNEREATAVLCSFKLICKNLSIYKTYLPASLVDEESSSHSDTSKQSADATTSSFNSTINSSLNTETLSMASGRSDMESLNAANAMAIKFDRDIANLKLTEVAYMIVDVNSFEEFCENATFDVILRFHTTFIELVGECVGKYRGDVLHFDGSTVIVTFNAVRRCVTFLENATLAAWEIIQTFKSTFPDTQSPFSSVLISIVNDTCLVGNIGYRKLRRFNVLGKLGAKCRGIVAKMKLREEYPVLVDARVQQGCKFKFKTKLVDYFENDEGKKNALFTLTGKKDNVAEDEEWLYRKEVQDHLTPEVVTDYDSAWELFLSAHYSKARAKILRHLAKHDECKDSAFLLSQINAKETAQGMEERIHHTKVEGLKTVKSLFSQGHVVE